MTEDAMEEKSNERYDIVGFTLGIDIKDYAEVLGTPNLDLVAPDGTRSRMYHDAQDDIILNLLTDSDRIVGIRYVHYDNSDESYALDLANYIGNAVPEQQLANELGVMSTVTGNTENTYYFGAANMANWVKSDVKNGQILEVVLSNGRFFNIGGLRIGDSLDKANTLFGTPISTTDGIDGVKMDTFKHEAFNWGICERVGRQICK
ncbi:hypothetical protein DX902_23165 [Paenibacillus jamilae]|uniref:hypothetical protein n=1 Tax=Paenibacillus TaxID=44249 RepID=UPI000E3EBF51|nr:hypothetical protein [Paenibacillus jamilae]RFT92999.1 hypothetical protein DX902_23165 [Paenibacillus jamilae]